MPVLFRDQSPVLQIAENAGTDGSIVVGKLTHKSDPNFGYDAQSGEYKDMVTPGSKGIDIDDLKSRLVAPATAPTAIGADMEIGRAP